MIKYILVVKHRVYKGQIHSAIVLAIVIACVSQKNPARTLLVARLGE
jgi:hypothetical protein